MYKITDVQLFDYAIPYLVSEDGDFDHHYSYSANMVINDSFIVIVCGNSTVGVSFDIADPDICYWKSYDVQKEAFKNLENVDINKYLKLNGFENNINWLSENATDIINPENKKFRFKNSDTK